MLKKKENLPVIPVKPNLIGISFTPEWYASKNLIEAWELEYARPCLVLRKEFLNRKMVEGWEIESALSSISIMPLNLLPKLKFEFEWDFLTNINFTSKDGIANNVENFNKLLEENEKNKLTLKTLKDDLKVMKTIISKYE